MESVALFYRYLVVNAIRQRTFDRLGGVESTFCTTIKALTWSNIRCSAVLAVSLLVAIKAPFELVLFSRASQFNLAEEEHLNR